MMGLWQCPSHWQSLCDKQVFFALARLSGVVWLVDLKHGEFISHSFEYCFVRCQIQAWDQLVACHEHWGQVWGSWPIDMFLIPCYEILFGYLSLNNSLTTVLFHSKPNMVHRCRLGDPTPPVHHPLVNPIWLSCGSTFCNLSYKPSYLPLHLPR
jgi:hypothetical protein